MFLGGRHHINIENAEQAAADKYLTRILV